METQLKPDLVIHSHRTMNWAAIFLLILAGIYVVVERGQSRREKILRWMVITGAILMALLLGSGALAS